MLDVFLDVEGLKEESRIEFIYLTKELISYHKNFISYRLNRFSKTICMMNLTIIRHMGFVPMITVWRSQF